MKMEKKLLKKNFLPKNLKTRQLTENEKILLSLLGSVILIWGSFRFIIIPQKEKLQTLNIQKIEYQGKINEINMILRKEDDINKEWNDLHVEKKSIISNYFPIIDQAQIIYLLNDLIEHEDVSVVDLNFSRPTYEDIGVSQVKSMDISLPYTGNYEGIVDIVNSIGKGPRKILVDSLIMDGNLEGNLNGNLNGNLGLKVYSLDGIVEVDSDIIYIDTLSKGEKSTPFAKYDDYYVKNEDKPTNINDTIGVSENASNEKDVQTKSYSEEILLDFEDNNNYFLPSQPLVKGNVIQSTNSKSKQHSLRFEYDILAVGDENVAYIDISKNNITLKYPPNSIGIWLYSYGYSPVTVGVGFRRQTGEDELLPLTEGIGWTGWKYLEVNPPDDLNLYPLKLDKLYIDMPKDREDFGVILLDKLEAIYTRNLGEDGTDKSISEHIFHVVDIGDTPERISKLYYGTDKHKNEILQLNEMKIGDVLPLGKILVLKKR